MTSKSAPVLLQRKKCTNQKRGSKLGAVRLSGLEPLTEGLHLELIFFLAGLALGLCSDL